MSVYIVPPPSAKRLPKCPRCSRRVTKIVEYYAQERVYEVDGVEIIPVAWNDFPTGKLTAACECGHDWTIRGRGYVIDYVPEEES